MLNDKELVYNESFEPTLSEFLRETSLSQRVSIEE